MQELPNIDQPPETWAARMARWLRRYGAAEIAAIVASYAGYFLTIQFGGAALLAAWVAAMTENLGFYGVVARKDLRGIPAGQRGRVIARMVAEFGPAELLDSFLLRPLAVAFCVAMVGAAWGVLGGKLIADAGFYVLAIVTHEYMRRRDRDRDRDRDRR